ncbi:hypothetical protein [Mesorhizobium sp. L48C026A00]|uniref:hypothetical protein n=1 Tax=Mesorhizobium sp. L48C026A00 TaxID=1287182 RepID=UPI0003D04E3F|nr:hypothetical protein [Mesorhizobium sp. L48C026A00]ESZ08450.1 hypothetical protein X737_33390 [Mesorhizobium sp. L48C026A00]
MNIVHQQKGFATEPMCFSNEVYRQFANRVSRTLYSDLGYAQREAVEVSGQLEAMLTENGSGAYPDIYDFLAGRGVRDRWNGVFYHCRSAAMAHWLLPHIRGTTIDLLCGSGKLGGILSEMGVLTTVTERDHVRDSYPSTEDSVTWLDHDTLTREAVPNSYDTVLLITALHHEADSEGLLQFAVKLASKRVIIVENCVEPDLSNDLHILVDDFFNYGLNKTPLPCPAAHRSADEWSKMLNGRGRVIFTDRRDSIPGILLSHHLLVAEVSR